MVNKEEVAAVLELIRPSLQADGGDVRACMDREISAFLNKEKA